MRRMRDVPIYSYLLIIPALGAAIGIQYLLRHEFPEGSVSSEITSVMKPSFYRNDSANGSVVGGVRELAHLPNGKADTKYSAIDPTSGAVASKDDAVDAEGISEEEEEEARFHAKAVLLNGRKESESGNYGSGSTYHASSDDEAKSGASDQREPASVLNAIGAAQQALGVESVGGMCSSVEYRGDGLKLTKISDGEWGQVMATFHGVKADLLQWLRKHKVEFADKTYAALEKQVEELKVQRPPSEDEPDLAWRGIGVWSQDKGSAPVVKMGSGLVKLILKQKSRGRFELARLVAQAWAPCELQRINAGEAWGPLLSCLGVDEANACGPNTYSEGGWAISSAMAAIVSDPGCIVPAFRDEKVAQCLKKVPLPLSLADRGARPWTNWKEARR